MDYIDYSHNSPELWNSKITDYKDRITKNDMLKQISGKYDYCRVMEAKQNQEFAFSTSSPKNLILSQKREIVCLRAYGFFTGRRCIQINT